MNLQLASDIMNAMISAGEEVVGRGNLPEEIIAASRCAYIGAVTSRYAPFVTEEQAKDLSLRVEAATIEWIREAQGHKVRIN